MSEHSEKADPSAKDDATDSLMDDQEEFEVEEDEVEIDEEEDDSEGEENEAVEVEEEENEEEEVDEVEEEEGESGDSDGEEVEELEEDDEDPEQEEVEEFEEGEEEGEEDKEQEVEEVEEGEEDKEQEVEEVEEDEKDADCGDEEIEEEEVLVEDERRGEGEEVSAVISEEPASAALEDAKDSLKMVGSEVHDKSQNALSFLDRDWNAEKYHEYDRTTTKINKFNGRSVGNESFAIVSQHSTFEENGIPETLLGEKGVGLEKEITNESPKYLKNKCLETQGSHHPLGSDNARSLQPLKSDVFAERVVINESEIENYDVSEKGDSHLQEKTDSLVLEDSTLTCGHTPRRRPRSSSPGSEPDKMNKRLAKMCVFYARGWCIKGNSCKFLHQKDEVNITEQQTKDERAGLNRASDPRATTDSDELSERSKVSSVRVESNPMSSTGCNSFLQRALVRQYGTGSHVASQLNDHYDMHTKGEFRQSDHFQAFHASAKEEYKKPFGKMGYFESIAERQPDDTFLSRRHLIEGKLNEINVEDSSCDIAISERTHLVEALVSDAKHYSNSSAISSILRQNSISPSAYGRKEVNAIRSAQRNFLNQESYNSHSLVGSLNSGLGGSFQRPQFDYEPSWAGTSPTSGSTRNSEYLEGQSLLDLDRRYGGSRSISLIRDSSPYHSRPELRNMIHHNISGDLTSRQTTKIQYDAWEPSRPFRPSSAIATKNTSSPSQYDPILDSIEPANANARDCFQTSKMTSYQNASFLPTTTGNAISWDGTLAKNVSLHDSIAHNTTDVFFTSIKLEGGNSSTHNNENLWNPDRFLERSNNKDAELGGECRNIDKSRNIKETKALKIFHTALVDFVKELLKPWWREGQLSKDAHKTVVKKSVEKVLSALHSHQIPSTQEAINQYLTTSRSKILKLVEGYTQKHANL